MSLFRKKATPPPQRREPVVHPTADEKPRSWLSSLFGHYTAENQHLDAQQSAFADRFKPYDPPPGVRGQDHDRLACDSASNAAMANVQAWAASNSSAGAGWLEDGLFFMGYPYLAEMAQRPEFRKPCDVLARETTREWIRLKSTKNINITDYDTDDEANAAREQQSRETAEKISAIEAEFKRLDVRALLYRMVLDALLNGVGYVWIDMAGLATDATGQNVPLKLTKHGVKKGSLNGFKRIDPIWTSANAFNADTPLRDGFYDPESYWVQGCLTHKDRLLKMVPYEVPDIFKPAFNFGGLSLTQQLRPYVHNFLRTRNSVSDITANFSKLVLKTDMTAAMQGGVMDHNGTSTIMGRASFMQQVSEGQSTIVADKENEDVSIVATPLGGLSDLQAQAMEAMAFIPGIPLVKLFGITPNGLNASSEGEIRVFYDGIAAFQENNLRPILEKILRLVQLNLWGELDESLDFDFVNLWQLDDEKAASVEKAKAEADKINIEAGKITPDEARMREEQDQNSLYRGVNLSGEAPGIPETEPPNLGGSEGGDGDM